MPTGERLLRSKGVGFALYALVMLVCVFGAAATEDTALKVLAFVVLGAVVAGRIALRTRAQLRQLRGSESPRVPLLLDLMVVRHVGLVAVGTIGLLLGLVGLADSGPVRIALLVVAGLVAVTALFGQRALRQLRRRGSER